MSERLSLREALTAAENEERTCLMCSHLHDRDSRRRLVCSALRYPSTFVSQLGPDTYEELVCRAMACLLYSDLRDECRG